MLYNLHFSSQEIKLTAKNSLKLRKHEWVRILNMPKLIKVSKHHQYVPYVPQRSHWQDGTRDFCVGVTLCKPHTWALHHADRTDSVSPGEPRTAPLKGPGNSGMRDSSFSEPSLPEGSCWIFFGTAGILLNLWSSSTAGYSLYTHCGHTEATRDQWKCHSKQDTQNPLQKRDVSTPYLPVQWTITHWLDQSACAS